MTSLNEERIDEGNQDYLNERVVINVYNRQLETTKFIGLIAGQVFSSSEREQAL